MRSGPVAVLRMRFALGLTIVGAVLLMAGLIMILVGETLRLKSAHSQGLVAGGEIAAIFGLACGVALPFMLAFGPDRQGRVVTGQVVTGPVVSGRVVPGPVVAGDVNGPALSPLPPPAGFVSPGATAPPAEPHGAAWSAPGYADEGWPPQPNERWDPQAGPGWDPRAGPGWPSQAEGGWSQGPAYAPAYAWHPAGQDDWDGGEADDWGPDGQGDWGRDGHDWIADGQDGWGRDGHDWIADGQDGWGRDAWAHQGGDAWVPDGGDAWAHQAGDAWVADGRGGWMPPDQVPVGQEGWTGPPGQAPGGQAAWAEPAGDEWSPDDQGAWIPDERAGSTHPDADDWGRAAAVPYPAGPPDEYLEAPGTAQAHPTGPQAAADEGRSGDDDDTSPIPVILGDASAPRPPEPEPFSVWEPAKPRDRRPDEPYRPEHAEPPSADTQEKIEQIKDLYVTAETIGEDALVKHFEQLKTRQRSLIREFFEKAGLGPKNPAHSSQHAGGDAVGESAPDSASLPPVSRR